MPSNEIKRQFTLGKMEKDKDDRLVEPGAYRDANNIDVSRSEGDDSGALQVVRGNIQPVAQDIDWTKRVTETDIPVCCTKALADRDADCTGCPSDEAYVFTELIKPFGETIGVYPYPQEEKVYFWNTGRPVNPNDPDVEQPLQNAIFEYDQTNNTVAPIIIESDQGDYEAGGTGQEEFLGEMMDTQVWGKVAYQDDTDVSNTAFQYINDPSIRTEDFALINLTCSSTTVIDRDDDDNPIYHDDGNFCSPVCTDPSEDDCSEASLFYEADNNVIVCRVGGMYNTGDICDCANVGTDDCDYAQYQSSDCPIAGGVTRTEEDCRSAAGAINDDLNFESTDNLVLEYDEEEYPVANWTITPTPQTDIQYQVLTTTDLESDACTPVVELVGLLGTDKYTLNGNGADLQPEEFCDPRCKVFNPTETTDPAMVEYPDYCLKTPILDSLYDTQLTDAAITHNRTRVVTMTNVPGVTDGEIINATLKRLVPQATTLAATFNTQDETWTFTAPEDNGRGVQTAENAVILRGMDALDFQQFDQIFGNVGLASRPVGYSYRVARNGVVSWTPNSDSAFSVAPDEDTEPILTNINALDASIPADGGDGENLVFNVNVDRQQQYSIDVDELTQDEIDDNVDDRTK